MNSYGRRRRNREPAAQPEGSVCRASRRGRAPASAPQDCRPQKQQRSSASRMSRPRFRRSGQTGAAADVDRVLAAPQAVRAAPLIAASTLQVRRRLLRSRGPVSMTSATAPWRTTMRRSPSSARMRIVRGHQHDLSPGDQAGRAPACGRCRRSRSRRSARPARPTAARYPRSSGRASDRRSTGSADVGGECSPASSLAQAITRAPLASPCGDLPAIRMHRDELADRQVDDEIHVLRQLRDQLAVGGEAPAGLGAHRSIRSAARRRVALREAFDVGEQPALAGPVGPTMQTISPASRTDSAARARRFCRVRRGSSASAAAARDRRVRLDLGGKGLRHAASSCSRSMPSIDKPVVARGRGATSPACGRASRRRRRSRPRKSMKSRMATRQFASVSDEQAPSCRRVLEAHLAHVAALMVAPMQVSPTQ